ncbi:hypothetical protein FOA52_004474 [Chlamydomonas sp. UWO 241]|nr:hypothetical protein FOA52_004474 [Chlamydomonas sp. UWO 241]
MAAASLTEAYAQLADRIGDLSPGQKVALGVAGGVAGLALASTVASVISGGDYINNRPTSFQLSGGAIEKGNVKREFDAYSASYGTSGTGTGIKDRNDTVHLVDVFYSLVTDMYEWGWGQSFHFSPKLPNHGLKASEVAHETRIAATLGLRPGMKALDCGCGVGGPLRTIASVSGAHVTGVTINQYQVDRATYHNNRSGLSSLTSVVRGDFTQLPFEKNTFDGAYAIEATCHAPKLEMVYGEVFRVLKPGSMFVTYEWVGTNLFDEKNPDHVRIMDEINYGNGLPEMRTYKQAEAAGKLVGFELMRSEDLATLSPVTGAWYDRLKATMRVAWVNKAIVNTLHALWLLPHGMKEVHDMLAFVAVSLVQGGESGVFTPMHMLVFRKPGKAADKA